MGRIKIGMLSIAITLVGMIMALFNDEISPRR
jgi:hypothetical protein